MLAVGSSLGLHPTPGCGTFTGFPAITRKASRDGPLWLLSAVTVTTPLPIPGLPLMEIEEIVVVAFQLQPLGAVTVISPEPPICGIGKLLGETVKLQD